LEELRYISTVRYDVWLICGDFNAIRFKHEKSEPNFHSRARARFNVFLDDYNLIEYELANRRFKWSNGRQFALLDRFICRLEWDSLYNDSMVRDLAKYGSDHCPLVLQTNMISLKTGYIFRCDKTWFDVPEFNELVLKWWLEFQLSGDIGKSWHEKMKFMRRKIRGWHKNFLGEKRRKKQKLLKIL
jgi:hypothetical protein